MAEENSANKQNEMLRYLIWLSMVFGAGNYKVHECLSHFDDNPQALYEALVSGEVPHMPPQLKKDVRKHTLAEAENVIYYCRQHDITLLTQQSEEYPECLRNVPSPPLVLTAKGNLSLLGRSLSLTVVGTRSPSEYSLRVTNVMLTEICKCGFVIVSGFAKGIDAAAHEAALDYGAGTIAVLGCGINVNYPRENAVLRNRMLSSGKGLLLSEFMPGVQPYPGNFPRRNRILSGLSYATAVMEAAVHSGSLVTADCALEQGRFVFCVPPADLFDKRYAGVVTLLRDGAYPLMSHQDVLIAYYLQFPGDLYMDSEGVKPSDRLICQDEDGEDGDEPAEMPDRDTKEESGADSAETSPKQADTGGDSAERQTAQRMPESELGQRIVQYLREHGDTAADDIANALDEELGTVFYELTTLELDNFVQTLLGKLYRAVES